jgi:hypothetical protein
VIADVRQQKGMTQRSYPDSTFSPDGNSSFYSDQRLRSALTLLEVSRFFIGCAAATLFLVVLVLVGIVFKINGTLWIVLCCLLSVGLGWVFSFLPIVRRVPLRCSRCLRLMCRVTKKCSSDPAAVFYICASCKLYVDSGHGEGVS